MSHIALFHFSQLSPADRESAREAYLEWMRGGAAEIPDSIESDPSAPPASTAGKGLTSR